jgi:hypothetical protein
MVLAASYGSVEDIEILWTLIAALGLSFSLYNLREAHKDKVAVEEAKIVNGRAKIAMAVFYSEITRAVKQAVFAVIGILAATLPASPSISGLPWKVVVASIIIKWGLILASALTAYQSYIAFQLRKDLLRGD